MPQTLLHFQIHKSRAKLPQQKMSSPSNPRASSTIIFHSEHRIAKQQATKKVLHTFPGFDLARNQFFLIQRYAQIYYASAKWSFLQQVAEHTLPLGASDRHNAIPKHSILQFQCFYIEPHLLFHYVEPTFVNDGKNGYLQQIRELSVLTVSQAQAQNSPTISTPTISYTNKCQKSSPGTMIL